MEGLRAKLAALARQRRLSGENQRKRLKETEGLIEALGESAEALDARRSTLRRGGRGAP